MAILLWRTLAVVSVALGMLGIALPGLPTVPFLILAAWSASRGWPALEQYLLDHPRHGDTIRRWREQGAVPRKAKVAATLMMLASTLSIFLLPTPVLLRWLLPPSCWRSRSGCGVALNSRAPDQAHP